jgi:hypothetical protein
VSPQSRPTSRRRRLIIALGVVVVAAVALVAFLVVRGSGSSSSAPSSPAAAAQQWATAVIGHASSRVRKLECSQGSQQDGLFELTNAVASGVTVRSTSQTGDSWTVVLDVQAPGGGGTQFPVPVVRQDGQYRVC